MLPAIAFASSYRPEQIIPAMFAAEALAAA